MLPFANNPDIEALLAQYALPDEERKRLLLGNVLLGIGGGLMSGKRGNEIGAAGSGAVVGAQMGQQAVNDARANQFAGLKTRMGLQEYIDKEKARKQESDDQAEVGKILSSGPQLQNMGPGGPTPQNAAAVAPMGQIERYRQAAVKEASKRQYDNAKKLNEMADKMEEEYSTSPQTVRGADGKLQLAQFGKRGGIKIADGMMPAEKLHFASTGGMAGVGMDPYSGAQVSQGLPVTMDPAQADASKRGWAQYQLSKNADQREAASQGSGPKAPEGYRWSADGKSMEFIPGGPQDPSKVKAEKPSDEQLKTGGFVERMQFADKYISALEKSGYRPSAGEAAVQGLSGVPIIGGVLGAGGAAMQGWVEPKAAEYKNVKKAWIRAKLRKESGAVIGAEEEADEDRTFFPQPGDPLSVVAQKAALRKNTEQSMAKQARGGYQGGAVQDDPLGLRR